MTEVLFVDDEPSLRQLIINCAEQEGIDLETAGTADEAITVILSHPELRAVITDLFLDGNDTDVSGGSEVMDAALAAGVNHVVLATGWSAKLDLDSKVIRIEKEKTTQWLRQMFGKKL